MIAVWMSGAVHKRGAPTEAVIATTSPSSTLAPKPAVALSYDDAAAATAAPAVGSGAAADISSGGAAVAEAATAAPATSVAGAEVHPERRARNLPWFDIPAFPQLNGPDAWDYHGYR